MGAQVNYDGATFQMLMGAAERGEVLVADVFAALRKGEISEEECRKIIATFEHVRVPTWRRILVSSQ